MSIRIEKVVPSDAAMLLEYLKQVGGETDNLTFGSKGMPFSVEAEAEFIFSMENSRDDIMLLAKSDDKIVGCASLNRLPRRMKHRGDFEVIDLQVRSDNKSAIHLYEKYGFKKIGKHPAFFKIGDENISFNIMCLKINE